MIADETTLQGWAEMYDGYGAVAREAAVIAEALTVALHSSGLTEVPALVAEALRRVERIYEVAKAERERWAR